MQYSHSKLIINLKNIKQASENSNPLSPLTIIPKIKICDIRAPNTITIDITIAAYFVLGIRIQIEIINSITPKEILPKGSTPILVNIYTESGCAVNLK